MNIGFISDCINNKTAGIGVYTQGVIHSLTKYHKSNTYYYIDKKKSPKKNNILVSHSFFFGKKILWYNFLPFALKNYPLDFIFNFYSIPHWQPFKQKEVLFIHDISAITHPHFHNRRSHMIFKLLYKKTIYNAYKIVANSNATKKSIMSYFNIPSERIHVLFVPYITPLADLKCNIEQPFILNINTIEPRKNIINLVAAFEYLKDHKKIPHKLIIAGQLGWKYKPVLQKITMSRYAKDIILTGYISTREKYALLTKADVFVYPSFYEGLGIPILEAAIHKCPVVCSKLPMSEEYLQGKLITVDQYNSIDIAQKIIPLLTKNANRQAYIAKCYKAAMKIIDINSIKKNINEFSLFLES